MRHCSTVLTVAVALACASSPVLGREKETIGGAVVQPLRDLSIMRTKTPPILLKAAEAPYAPAGDCKLMAEEISDLDAVLGDDIGSVNDNGGTIVTSLVKSAVKLPFNSVVRRITGAHKRDQAYEDALVAGVARRGFLKGSMTACGSVPLVETAAPIMVIPDISSKLTVAAALPSP